MMRNLFLTVLLFIATTSSAQVIKSNTLKSYKEGDMLEKGIYSDKKDAIAADTCGLLLHDQVRRLLAS